MDDVQYAAQMEEAIGVVRQAKGQGKQHLINSGSRQWLGQEAGKEGCQEDSQGQNQKIQQKQYTQQKPHSNPK